MPIIDLVNLDTSDLGAAHIGDTPKPYDWKAWTPDDSEERPWTWAEAVECPHCKRSIVALNGYMVDHHESEGGYIDSDDDEEIEEDDSPICKGSNEWQQSAEGPMMDYWYPCEFFKVGSMADAAARLVDLPFCAVEVDGKAGFALTGGGMDFSWEICEAYIRLGHLPPFHFAKDMPDMSERLTARNLAILGACEESCEWMENRAKRAREDVKRLRGQMGTRPVGETTDLEADARIGHREKYLATLIDRGNRNGVDPDRVLDIHHDILDGEG